MRALTAQQKGKGLVKVNGKPLSLVQPEILRFKVRAHLYRQQHFPRHPLPHTNPPSNLRSRSTSQS
jgi:hypothetical protein